MESPKPPSRNWEKIIRTILLALTAVVVICCVSLFVVSKIDTSPKRKYDPKMVEKVELKQVNSTWRFETIYQPRRIDHPSIALDSRGHAHVAYGGDQLYYTWFDGATWHKEIPDERPGAGQQARIFLDANDRPHFIHVLGEVMNQILVHTYRGEEGWMHEQIYEAFCRKDIGDAVMDPSGNISIVFDGSPDCMKSYPHPIWFVRQTSSGWQVAQVAEHGYRPTLAYNPSGQPHIHYDDYELAKAYVAAQSADGWESREIEQQGCGVYTLSHFFDSHGTQHILVATHVDIPAPFSTSIYHCWQDRSGWHRETVRENLMVTRLISAYPDAEDRLNFLYWDESGLNLLRRGADGWQDPPALLHSDRMAIFESDVKFDRYGKIHLIIRPIQNSAIQYLYQAYWGWESIKIDQGDTLMPYTQAALAFDREGNLATGFYTSGQSIQYLWKDKDTWKAEKVGTGVNDINRYPMDLLFDLENRPCLFYIGPRSQSNGTNLYYAVKENGKWRTQLLPFVVYNDKEWSEPEISPEGWPVLYRRRWGKQGYEPWLIYFPPARSQQQSLSSFLPLFYQSGYPQSAYPPQAPTPPAGGGVSLPAFVYITGELQEVAYFDPRNGVEETLPVLQKNQSMYRSSLAFDPLGRAVIIIEATTPSEEISSEMVPNMLYVTQTETGWHAYQLGGLTLSNVQSPFLDKEGQAHFVAGYKPPVGESTSPFQYVTGSGTDWKITNIQGAGLNMAEHVIGRRASALRVDTGEFCVEFYDQTANDLIIGCLESIE